MFNTYINTCNLLLNSVLCKTLTVFNTLKRNRNATRFQWKMHLVLFKVLNGDNEPSSFQEMLKTDVRVKTDCISFPSRGFFPAK